MEVFILIRVFPRRTKWTPDDELVFVGDPPFFRPSEEMPVYVSVTFIWDIPEGQRLQKAWAQYYSNVQIGGPAFGDPGGEFEPGRFIKPGVTITSRGCPHYCSWCHVHNREGQIRELSIKEGYIVQDNNLLACSREHIKAVFEMLRKQKKGIYFKGGLDIRLLKPWHIDLLKSIKIKELWIACDNQGFLPLLENACYLLSDFPQRKKRCYVMIGWCEPIDIAESRLERVYELGFLPFSQLYQSDDRKSYSSEWLKLNRKWSRPAAYRPRKNLIT